MRLVWAFVDPTGRILTDNFRSEAQTWAVALGWPTEQEIETAKKQGCRVMQARIDINGPWDEPLGILWRRQAQPDHWFYGTLRFAEYIQGDKYEYKSIYATPPRMRMLARQLVEYLDRHVPNMDLNSVKEELRAELDKR